MTFRRLMPFVGLAILIVLSLILGVSAMPYSPALTHDSAVFLNSAENLAQRGSYQIDMAKTLSLQPSRTVCAFMPGYSAVLALLLLWGLEGKAALYVLTLLTLILLTSLFYALIWQLTKSLWAALAGGVWLAVFPPILNTMTYALTESLYIPLSVIAFLVAAIYLRSAEPKKKHLILTGFLLALAPWLRLPAMVLVAVIGGVVVLRSLLQRRWRRAVVEAMAVAISQLPLGLYLIINPYCANNLAGYTVERTTRTWLAQLLISQFTPQLELGLGLRRVPALLGGRAGIAAMAIVAVAACLVVAWRYRRELWSAIRGLADWAYGPIVAYVMIYLGLFFWSGNTWAKFDFPRYFVPTYPFLILLAVVGGYALYRHLNAVVLRGGILLLLAVLMVSNVQATAKFVPLARQGRGIEAPEIRDHPAIAYVRNNLHGNDLLYSTLEPTLWYYLSRPVRRLEGIQKLRCQELPQPEPGGRSVFVLFPSVYYTGDPTTPSDTAWFQQWASPCGTVTESTVLQDAAIHILEPFQK